MPAYTPLDSKLKSNPDLKEIPVRIRFGEVKTEGSARKTQFYTLNRIFNPLHQVRTMDGLREALGECETNADKLGIFDDIQIDLQSEYDADTEGQIVTISPTLKEKDSKVLGWELNQKDNLKVYQGFKNVFGFAESFLMTETVRGPQDWKIAPTLEFPLTAPGFQSFQVQPLFYEKKGSDYGKGISLKAQLKGGHTIGYQYNKRSAAGVLSMLSYVYEKSSITRNPVTQIPQGGANFKFQCDMAGITQLNDFVRAQFTANFYATIRYFLTSLHFRIGGIQSDMDNSSISQNDLVQSWIRGQKEASRGNFSMDVMARVMFPMAFLGTFYQLTKIHGQFFVQAGNSTSFDFNSGDLKKGQEQFVKDAQYSVGGGLYIPINDNHRIELNVQQDLGSGGQQKFQMLWTATDLL